MSLYATSKQSVLYSTSVLVAFYFLPNFNPSTTPLFLAEVLIPPYLHDALPEFPPSLDEFKLPLDDIIPPIEPNLEVIYYFTLTFLPCYCLINFFTLSFSCIYSNSSTLSL